MHDGYVCVLASLLYIYVIILSFETLNFVFVCVCVCLNTVVYTKIFW